MILDKEVEIYITNRNITYYRNKGYDIEIGRYFNIKIEDVNPNSTCKVNVECSKCSAQNKIKFVGYNKRTSNFADYCCKKCGKFKKDVDIIGKKISNSKKNKYDKITQEIEEKRLLRCNKCKVEYDLLYFGKNRNGRYIPTCKDCKKNDFKIYYNNLNTLEKRKRKREYYRNSIHQNLWRSILKSYLFRRSLKKLDETIDLLKYTTNDLKSHLESKFIKNMNWKNYGKIWQVDHIIPVSFFEIHTPIHIVNSLENLRPLDSQYNLSRGNKLDDEGYKLFEKFETYIKEEYINIYKDKIKNLK